MSELETPVPAPLTSILMADHKRMQALCAELKARCGEGDPDNERVCFNLFRGLKALITSHSKAEEYTLYSLFEGAKKAHEKLRHFVLEGYEEHDIIDGLLKEMGQADQITEEWQAQLTVVSELLDHHIKEEENDFFPKVKEALDPEVLIDLGVVYCKERDDIFIKIMNRTRIPARQRKVPDGADTSSSARA